MNRSVRNRARGLLAFCLLAFGISSLIGCRVGPDYLRPHAEIAGEWIDSSHPRLQGEPVDPRHWWTAFHDPVLEELVHQAATQNLTVREAGMRVMEAQAAYGISRGNFFPQTQQINGNFTHTGVSANRPNFPNIPGFSRGFDNWQLGFAATWEVDFWGRFRRAIDAAEAELDASIENHDDILVILLGDVAYTYIELRTLERRIHLAQENAEIQDKTLKLVKHRLDAGTVTELDYAQSETNLRDTQATIPNLERLRREANNRLCILLGLPVRDLTQEIGDTGAIPQPPAACLSELPADLLRRRPDVRRVERQLAAQSERIGIAKAEFYPHLGLGGNIGWEAARFSQLFNGESVGGSLGPTMSWNILNFGRIKNNVRVHEARFQQLAYNYKNTVLKANAEVENALIGFIKTNEQVEYLNQSAKAARRAMDLSVIRYEGGKADFNEVFVLQAQLVRKLDAVAQAQGEVATTFVGIYRGLGGGWEIRLGNFASRSSEVNVSDQPLPMESPATVPNPATPNPIVEPK